MRPLRPCQFSIKNAHWNNGHAHIIFAISLMGSAYAAILNTAPDFTNIASRGSCFDLIGLLCYLPSPDIFENTILREERGSVYPDAKGMQRSEVPAKSKLFGSCNGAFS